MFHCDKWFDKEKYDGKTERLLVLSSAAEEDKGELMRKNIRHKFYNDHLWVSLAMRKWRSNFTRCQRLSCILAIFYLSMIANAMFYRGSDESAPSGGVITIGKMHISVNDLITGFFSSIIVIIPVTLITFGFMNSATRKDLSDKDYARLQENIESQGLKHKIRSNKSVILPYWCRHLTWLLVFLSVAVSAFFTILYSFQWGRVRSTAWLTAFLFSKFSNVFIVEPLKVKTIINITEKVLKLNIFSLKQKCL